MKKIIYLKMAVLMAVVMSAAFVLTNCGGSKKMASTSSEPTESLTERLKREKSQAVDKRLAELKQEGWKLSGSSTTFEVALLEHTIKLEDSKNVQWLGMVSNCKSINVCRQVAINNAITSYASMARSIAKGRIDQELRANANVAQEEIDLVVGGYERLVLKEVEGLFTESFALVKDNQNGTKEYQMYFTINEDKATSARKRAMEQSLKETKISLEEARQISDFVNEGFTQ
jgi:hypothetical protein